MENKQISRTFKLLSQLMELHSVNEFKTRSVANAAFKLNRLPFRIADKATAELEKTEGIGKSIAGKITELLNTGVIAELQGLLTDTPEGVVEMLGIKGIGPKKIAIIWHDLGIESVGELYYACNENRLIEAKGFGLKTQDEIRKAIEFKMSGMGKFLYPQVEADAAALLDELNDTLPGALIEFAGEYRRKCEVISELKVVVGSRDAELALETLQRLELIHNCHIEGYHLTGELENGLRVDIRVGLKAEFYKNLFLETGTEKHVEQVTERITADLEMPESEALIYQKSGLEFMPPELREDDHFMDLAHQNKLPQLITIYDLRGALHNHSTWSDGVHTLEQMAVFCRDELKLEYLGICDHSRSAVYASGLSIERVMEQHEEIDKLNKKLNGFRIFKGIESDILNDGSLDYPDEVLKTFDFIVASVHSNLKMPEDKATTRLIKAIENPYTTILGHPTGRLLLGRPGYPIDFKKIIDACAANKVVIEVNANPFRLDLDWRWHRYALEKGVLLSINPDAHRNEGFYDMRYGVNAARKGGLAKEHCLNAMHLVEIEAFFKSKH